MSDSEYICTAHVLQGNFFSEITISSLENPDFKQNNFHNGCVSFLLNPDLGVNFFSLCHTLWKKFKKNNFVTTRYRFCS